MVWFNYCLAGMAGLVIGSFLNVVIHRLPIMIDGADGGVPARYGLCFPPSSCRVYGRAIRWRDNIPLLGFVLLRGRCFHCRVPIGCWYPPVEIMAALTPILFASHFGFTPTAAMTTVFSWLGLCLVLIHLLRWRTLPAFGGIWEGFPLVFRRKRNIK